MKNEDRIGENVENFGEKEYILSFMNHVILAIIARHKNIPIHKLKRSGGASDIFHIAINMRNILHPNAHGVRPVIIAMRI